MDYSLCKVDDYLKELSSDRPTPGGGSATGMSNSLAASLLLMVIGTTKNKLDILKEYVMELKDIKKKAVEIISRDAVAFGLVVQALKLPHNDNQSKEKRQVRIQEALKEATLVPLDSMRIGLRLLEVSKEVIMDINPKAVADAGVSVLSAYGAVKGSYYNVINNTVYINDNDFVNYTRRRAKIILDKAGELTSQLEAFVEGKLQ